jgi:hypothetical protein
LAAINDLGIEPMSGEQYAGCCGLPLQKLEHVVNALIE